jgi:cell wall-associated NlpC family hydrolase
MRRIKVQVPALWGTSPSNWVPACGTDAVPDVETPVWVMFEMGEAHHPVWMGVAAPQIGGGSGVPYVAPKYDPTGPSGGSGTASGFIAEALAQVGKPYVYGAAGPNAFDCSGLVQYCLQQVGLTNVPRTSEDQYGWASPINYNQLVPGALIFEQWPEDDAPPGHVVIYNGAGTVIEAPHTGANVWVRPWSPAETTIVGYGLVPGLNYGE